MNGLGSCWFGHVQWWPLWRSFVLKVRAVSKLYALSRSPIDFGWGMLISQITTIPLKIVPPTHTPSLPHITMMNG